MQPVERIDVDCPGARCSAAELRQVRVAHHCRMHLWISQSVHLGLPGFMAAQTAAALVLDSASWRCDFCRGSEH